MTAELHECGRCGIEDRDVRSTIANREREAQQDGRPFEPPAYAIEYRCRDKEACRERVSRGSAA